MPETPPNLTAFLTIMAALSASVQTLVEHVIKKNWAWLDEPKQGKADNPRHVAIHGVVFALGATLVFSTGLEPLAYLGLSSTSLGNALAAGVLVSFGGSFFDEALGAVREFKKAQEKLRGGAAK